MHNAGPEFEDAAPPASALIESLRGVGYTLETAIADLIDNSITAGASTVRIAVSLSSSSPFVSILDDGSGMNEVELRNAMRPGSQSPLEERSEHDLGRFGLGLKTASFSQCRSLTVASSKDSQLSVRRWDLDYLADVNGEWRLLLGCNPDSEEHLADLQGLENGTLVLWEKLDRLPTDSDKRRSLEIVEQVERHLAMVFQRYLAGSRPRLKILINGARIRPWDPFLSSHDACQSTPLESIGEGSDSIRLQGFVLPNKDMLGPEEYQDAGGPEGWVTHQGFFVYRNDRLLLPGGWLGLGVTRPWGREETYKLARISLDLPNSLDAAWKIDVKKSAASPPEEVRPRLRDLAIRIREQARGVFVHRGDYGRRPPVEGLRRPWVPVKVKGRVAYRIDREHPLVRFILSTLDDENMSIESFLRIAEETVPVERIWMDTVDQGELPAGAFETSNRTEIREVAQVVYQALVDQGNLDPASARSQLNSLAPFDQFPEIVETLSLAKE